MLAANLTSCDSLKALVFTGCWFTNRQIRAKTGLLFPPVFNTVGMGVSLFVKRVLEL